jgi:hypothetical protein
MSKILETTKELEAALDAAMPDRRWLTLLELFLPTGVADASQLQSGTDLSRQKIRRALEIMETTYLVDMPVLKRLDHSIRQPGQAKRPPTIYLLAPGGAALLRANGHEARPCELKEDVPISHAVCMLSVHLAARLSRVEEITDKNLAYGDGQVLRPDHVITLPDQRKVILEIEQAANLQLITRIMESLSNRQAFFKSKESENFLPEVRMIVNAKPGSSMRRTLNIWENAVREQFKKDGVEMAFRLMTIPLSTFLDAPEWDVDLSERWKEIRFGLGRKTELDEEENVDRLTYTRRTLKDEVVLLEALDDDFDRRFADVKFEKADKALFNLALTLFAATYGYDLRRYLAHSEIPYRSLYLFNEYLNLHPDLRTRLKVALHANRGRVVLSQNNILHRIDIVIRSFLRYYGWQTSHHVNVRATMNPQRFGTVYGIHVDLPPYLFTEDDEHRVKEVALEWMLWAIFEYADELKLGRPDFW